MNHQERLKQIHAFLLPYERIWQNELMLLYPGPLKDYPIEWVMELAAFRDQSELIRLDKKDVDGLIQGAELSAFYRRIDELCQIPKVPELPPVPEDSFTWLFMIPKKQYEIKRLAPVVYKLFKDKNIARVVDIGGGKGLLAQTLVNQYRMPVTSFDMDPVLQETGRKRHYKNPRHPDMKVEFITKKVDVSDPTFNSLLRPDDMSLGLHTCGALATDQIRFSVHNKIAGLINLGCCYHKLENTPTPHFISNIARELSLPPMSKYALTLASRAHRKMDEKSNDLKNKVKLYRYAMHMLLYDKYDVKELTPLGNSSPKLYDESFGTYALEQLGRLKIEAIHSKEELDHYLDNPSMQTLIWQMLAAGFIRNAFGRLLELYILLDRVCYLEENGYKSQLLEFFDEELSPRNLGITAWT